MVLDNGEYWVPEGFQDEIVADIFSGVPEIMVVIPEGNGKTSLLGGVNLYVADFKATANCLVAAASREQAEILFSQAAGLVYRSPGFDQRFRVFEGYRRIRALRSHGRIQVKAADDRTGDGAIPDLATIDEPHRARDMSLWRTWRGKLDKRGGQILGISTAGAPGTEFEETREAMHRTATESVTVGRHTRSASPDALIHDWGLRRDDDLNDMELVKQVNPLSTISTDSLARKRRSPSMTDAHWSRFTCNIATRETGRGITPEEWDALEVAGLLPDLGAWCVGFLDLGWKHDTTAMGVLSWEAQDRRVISGVRIFEPPANGRVDEADVVVGILALQAEYPELQGIVFDPNAEGQQMAQLLAKGDHPLQYDNERRIAKGLAPLAEPLPAITFHEHTQDNAPMSLAASRLDEAVRMKWLKHDGHPGLRRHALLAVRVPLGGERAKYDRPADAKGERRSRYPIDALTGVLMGHSFAVGRMDRPKTKAPAFAWA